MAWKSRFVITPARMVMPGWLGGSNFSSQVSPRASRMRKPGVTPAVLAPTMIQGALRSGPSAVGSPKAGPATSSPWSRWRTPMRLVNQAESTTSSSALMSPASRAESPVPMRRQRRPGFQKRLKGRARKLSTA